MLHLAIIFHMHQPYYRNLLTGETEFPWVRLHGIKDYLDMVLLVKKYPEIKLTFNLVPSLLEQIEEYCNGAVKDKFFELSYKPAAELTSQDKQFILNNFFSVNKDKVISLFPRYFELYNKKQKCLEFTTQDYLDLQLLFNLAWTDPMFREEYQEFAGAIDKERFFSEDDKRQILDKQIDILKGIIPAYREAIGRGQVEVTTTPFYHPILPLLYNTNKAKEANDKTFLPEAPFAYPQDAKEQINAARDFFKEKFGVFPQGMWPSEESVCQEILPFIADSGINWIVADEAILFKSLKKKKRDTRLLYQPHALKAGERGLNIVFRDRNLSDMIGFTYYNMKAKDAVSDFMKHLTLIVKHFKKDDILVTIAMDGENAWEFYDHDGHDFLNLLYEELSESKLVKTTTVSGYIKTHPAKSQIKHLATGSWIFANFDKWMNKPAKAKAWEWLLEARRELEAAKEEGGGTRDEKEKLAWKQIYICEGSDWFWWYGEDPAGAFDKLYRMHLNNFYKIINKAAPAYLK